ncbi:MAG: SapC family protein [Candidatus Parcubacteria bacterium]|nr:SapC family protein [Burkholderiales bacterium]
MEIRPPFGYKDIVPLGRTQKVRLMAPGEVPGFARAINSIPISYSEFALVAREYPIIFTPAGSGQTVVPVAVLGMAAGENLYDESGKWASAVYVPAYVRRYPFCMTKVTLDKVEQQNRLICVEKSHVDEERGEAMFDAKGQPVAKWKDIEGLLTEFEVDLERSREMCGILADYGLLEPFTMQAKFDDGGAPLSLTGMQRVLESKIEHLNASQLKNLVKKGILSRVYAHLLSLDNFGKLLDRRASKKAA